MQAQISLKLKQSDWIEYKIERMVQQNVYNSKVTEHLKL